MSAISNVILNKETNKIIFDPEYFFVGKEYVTQRWKGVLTEYSPHELRFKDEFDETHVVYIGTYFVNIMFSVKNRSKSDLYSIIKSHSHYSIACDKWCMDIKQFDTDMIYRIGDKVDIINPDEVLVYNTTDINNKGLLFFMDDDIYYTTAASDRPGSRLFKKLGGYDVSVRSLSAEEFIKNVKLVKRAVYDGKSFADILHVDPNTLVRKTKVFNRCQFKEAPLLIYDTSGNRFLKRIEDSFWSATTISTVDSEDNMRIVDISEFDHAVELVTPNTIDEYIFDDLIQNIMLG